MNKYAGIAVLRVIAIVGQLIFIKLFTNFLTPSQIGYFYFYATISYFLNALILIPYDYFQQAEVFKLKEKGHNLNSIIKNNKWIVISVFILLILAFLITALIDESLIEIVILIIIVSLTLYLSTATKTFLNNHDEQLVVVGTMILELLVKIVVFLVLIEAGVSGPISVMMAMAFSQVAGLLFLSVKLLKHIRLCHGSEAAIDMRKVVNSCYPLSFSSILNWLQLQGYRLVLVPLGYAESVGIYSAISSIGGTGMNSAGAVYQQILQPRVYQTSGAYINTYLKWGGVMILGIFVVGMGLKDYIVEIIANKNLVEYASIIGLGVLIDSGNFLIGALVVYLSIKGKIHEVTKASILGFVVLLLFFLVLWVRDSINTYTIGIPLLASQFVIVSLLYYKSGIYVRAGLKN